MNRLERFRRDVVAALPQRVSAGLALAVGYGVQFLLVEVDKA
jgi:hypothetical protein